MGTTIRIIEPTATIRIIDPTATIRILSPTASIVLDSPWGTNTLIDANGEILLDSSGAILESNG